MNGFSGVISVHPKEGHPTFVRKPSDPDNPQLTLCIRLDDPKTAGSKTPTVLLEPRFLVPHDKFMRRVSTDLGATLAFLGGVSSSAVEAVAAQALGG